MMISLLNQNQNKDLISFLRNCHIQKRYYIEKIVVLECVHFLLSLRPLIHVYFFGKMIFMLYLV